MSNLITLRSSHSARLERWLGKERIEHMSGHMKGWYAGPIHLLDCPGSVRLGKDGDFVGPFERGVFMSALDTLEQAVRRAARVPKHSFNAGFTSISDALSRASGGFSQMPGGAFTKNGPSGGVGQCTSLHKVGAQPVAGDAGSAAPGGRAPVDTTLGGMVFTNPSAGSLRLVGADVGATVIGNTLLMYDRIFDVAKTMNSTANESVTGVPSRYQSSTGGAEDFAGGNFLFIETGLTALAATAHNWDTCLYRDESDNDAQALPTIAGVSASAAHRLDMTAGTSWFAPLASGDSGIKDLNQMHCSALVATGLINFVIGHPIGFMTFPVINFTLPFDWLTNRNQAPRIFDDAYLAFLELTKPSTTATTYTGLIYATSTAS